MVADSLEAVAQGFGILKIKVGKEGLADVERVAAIRQAVGPDIKLRVDANQGWTAQQSVSIIRAMEDRGLGIELVEQPVPAHDLAGLKQVTQAVDTPILADEAVFSHYDDQRLIQEGAADLINIKLMKTGGIWNALKICRMAAEHWDGVYDRLYAGVPAVRSRRGPSGRRAGDYHKGGPGRPLPVCSRPLHWRPGV